jgi:hypothetical protein
MKMKKSFHRRMVIYKSGSQRKVSSFLSLLLNYFLSLFEYLQVYLQRLSKYREKTFPFPFFSIIPINQNRNWMRCGDRERKGNKEKYIGENVK